MMESFFGMQQCGAQSSPLRKPCHLDDGIIRGGPRDGQPFDATGGWHDAGDYLKFVETTSYAVALMLFACDLHPPCLQPNRRCPPCRPCSPSAQSRASTGSSRCTRPRRSSTIRSGTRATTTAGVCRKTTAVESFKSWHPRPVFLWHRREPCRPHRRRLRDGLAAL